MSKIDPSSIGGGRRKKAKGMSDETAVDPLLASPGGDIDGDLFRADIDGGDVLAGWEGGNIETGPQGQK